MNDQVRRKHIDQVTLSQNGERAWRSHLALGMFMVMSVTGYVAMFLAFDSWFRG